MQAGDGVVCATRDHAPPASCGVELATCEDGTGLVRLVVGPAHDDRTVACGDVSGPAQDGGSRCQDLIANTRNNSASAGVVVLVPDYQVVGPASVLLKGASGVVAQYQVALSVGNVGVVRAILPSLR